MSEQQNLDLSKVISLIMENPSLVEQISNLAKGQNESTPDDLQQKTEEKVVKEQVEEPTSAPT